MIGLKNFCILYTCALYGDETLLDNTMNSFIPSGQSVVVIDLRHKPTVQPNGICKVISCEIVISKFCLVFFDDSGNIYPASSSHKAHSNLIFFKSSFLLFKLN